MGFSEWQTAASMRDLISEMVATEIARVSPPYRYGTVVEINRSINTCFVLFDPTAQPMPVKMGSIQPVRAGQFVRVDGVLGDKFISDVIGPTWAGHISNQRLALTGGGKISMSQFNLKWDQRFIAIGAGKTIKNNSYYQIDMPPDDTVIHGVDLQPDIIVGATTAGTITFPAWSALYYDTADLATPYITDPTHFHMAGYINADYSDIPDSWVMLATRNNDSRSSAWRFGTGRQGDYWHALSLTGFTNYGSTYAGVQYKKIAGHVSIEGLMQATASRAVGYQFATMPAGTTPDARLMFEKLQSPNAIGRTDIEADGSMTVGVAVPSGEWQNVTCNYTVG